MVWYSALDTDYSYYNHNTRSGILSVNKEFVEAAHMEAAHMDGAHMGGASRYGILCRIQLPLAFR